MTSQKSTRSTYNRKDIAKFLAAARDSNLSERAFAKSEGIPKSTMQGWRHIRANIKQPEEIVDFLEGEVGIDFLKRLVDGILFHLHESGGASLNSISVFLKDMGLADFIATSPTFLKERARTLQDQIIAFGVEQVALLNATMDSRNISIAEDETFFHGQTILVAMEPASNYILVETKVDDRKADTWNTQMDEGLSTLNVNVIQSCSDQGTSLIKHVEEHLGAESSADLFHISQDIGRAGSASLSLQLKKSKELLDKEISKTESIKKEKFKRNEFNEETEKIKISHSQKNELRMLADHREAQQKIKLFKRGRRGVSFHFHPFDIDTGQRQSPEKVEQLIVEDMQNCEYAIRDLSESSHKKLAKAKRLIPKMTASLKFFFATMSSLLATCKFEQRIKNLIEEDLVPAAYLLLVANKTKDKKKAQQILDLVAEKRMNFLSICETYRQYSPKDRDDMWLIAMDIAQVFQRSSSCVEGRNGQLSLKYHNLHRLSDKKLSSLTVLHNFHIVRSDGTTAAQRFFRRAHPPLFETILKRMPELSRPRKHTKKPA